MEKDLGTKGVIPPPLGILGFGAFFHPMPLTVSKDEIQLEKSKEPYTRTTTFEVKNTDEKNVTDWVIFSDDGLVLVLEKSEEDSLKFLNTIFATARNLWGAYCNSIIKEELISCIYIPEEKKVRIMQSNVQIGSNCFSLYRDGTEAEFLRWKIHTRQRKSPEVIADVIHAARAFTYNPKLHTDLMLVFSSLTQFNNKEYRAASVYAWIMIETFISDLWDDFISKLLRNSEERGTLKCSNQWTSYHQIEVLSMVGVIPPKSRKLFHLLRKKRNSIMHEDEEATDLNAKKFLVTAWILLRNKSRNEDMFTDVEESRLDLPEAPP